MRRCLLFGWTVAALLLLAPSSSAQTPALALRVGAPEAGWPVLVELGPILEDRSLQAALESALPLRFHLRVELWRRGILDRLVGVEEIDVALVKDPLAAGFSVETERATGRAADLRDAQQAIATILRSDLRPTTAGRHYYLATLEVETLSLTDLDELRRWLRGEVGPAVEGRAPATRAVESGLRRLMIRVIGLPTRRFEARTGTFEVS